MSLVTALEDLKLILLEDGTDDIETQIEALAEENGLKPVFLRNRAEAALGDLATWAARHRAALEADKGNQEVAARKIMRSKIEAKIHAHNDGTARVTSPRLFELMDAANALGGNWVVKDRRAPVRRREHSFEDLARACCALLGIDYREIRGL